jgi:SAM-dependent methyltransferase
VTARRFTGERLHEGDALFAVDMARHQAAYVFARHRIGAGRVLDLGSGSGHGAAQLAAAGATVVGVDRVAPDASSRGGGVLFVRADLRGLPFPDASFDLILSFQVVEHLEDPSEYLGAIARLCKREGLAILTTPNLLMSDRVNPYHVHEYLADELGERLREHFEEVEMCGVGMSDAVRAHMAERSRRIRRIVRLDPLRLRERLPAALVQRLFALFAVLVRRRGSARAPQASWRDFPIGAAGDDCIDLLALCRRPR